MQILKPKIRARILTAAEQQFCNKGYRDASMRSIAGEAGISVSNLYKYFDGKENLLDAVLADFCREFQSNLNRLFSDIRSETANSRLIDMIAGLIIYMIQKDRRKFIILMGQSDGTPYRAIRQKIVWQITDKLRESLDFREDQDRYLLEILSGNFFSAILAIAKYTDENREKLTIRINGLTNYHLTGLNGISLKP